MQASVTSRKVAGWDEVVLGTHGEGLVPAVVDLTKDEGSSRRPAVLSEHSHLVTGTPGVPLAGVASASVQAAFEGLSLKSSVCRKGKGEVLRVLERAAWCPDSVLAQNAILKLGGLAGSGSHRAARILCRLAWGDDSAKACFAISSLGSADSRGNEEALSMLESLISHGDEEKALAAINALYLPAGKDDEDALSILEDLAAGDDLARAEAAIEALGLASSGGSSEARRFLLSLACGSESQKARKASLELKNKGAVSGPCAEFIEQAKGADPEVAYKAIWSLGSMFADDLDVLVLLEALARGADRERALAATDALEVAAGDGCTAALLILEKMDAQGGLAGSGHLGSFGSGEPVESPED